MFNFRVEIIRGYKFKCLWEFFTKLKFDWLVGRKQTGLNVLK
jgi:hypothetical protein